MILFVQYVKIKSKIGDNIVLIRLIYYNLIFETCAY